MFAVIGYTYSAFSDNDRPMTVFYLHHDIAFVQKTLAKKTKKGDVIRNNILFTTVGVFWIVRIPTDVFSTKRLQDYPKMPLNEKKNASFSETI